MLNIHGRFGDQNRGLLNGPPEQWAEELAGLNADYGISGFILAADDAETTRTFAREVASAARELISGR